MSADPFDADVLVVGAGAGGLCVSIAAAEGGARVVLLDKAERIGGMLHIANGEVSGAGTRRQAAHGIDDDPVRHFADVLRISHDEIDRDLAWLSISRQGETVDWLETLGFDFDPATPGLVHGHEVYSVPRTYWGNELGRSVLRVLAERLGELVAEGRIDVRLGSAVTALVRDEAGVVTGVRTDVSGEPGVVHAAAVVLATGGYDADPAIRNRFLPEHCADVLIGCLDHATGEGLTMAEELGADVSQRGFFLPVMGLIPDPERPGHAVDYREAFVELAPAYRTPHEIWVNDLGARFIAEDVESPERRERALLEQPHVRMHIVFDRVAAERAEPLVRNGTGDWTRERWLSACDTADWVARGDTLEALAAAIGVDAAALRSTVDDYNRCVGAGLDAAHGRRTLPGTLDTGPFYAVTSVAASILSRDGLRVDERLRVLNRSGEPILGLHAVGELLGNNVFAGDNYVGGMSVTPAMTLGRLLGSRLASPSSDRNST